MSTVSSEEIQPPGVCLIKPEFVVKDHERTLCLEHVAKEDLAKLDDSVTSESAENTASSRSKGAKHYKSNKKLKGQNKERRANDKSEWKTKTEFCPDLTDRLKEGDEAQITNCSRGESCKFQHDASAYLATKPQDIGPECYVYRLTGYCPWGISCRFGGDHLTKEGANLINESLKPVTSKSRQNNNTLDKETITKLWKKRYDFEKSHAALKEMEKKFKRQHRAGYNPANKTEQTDDMHSKSDDLNETKDSSADERMVVDGYASDILMKNENSGAIDDSDLIKPRLEEKKKVDWKDLLYLSPLTTVGNLPFRRICLEYGADVTCSEMALAVSLLQGTREWSLTKRHHSEKIFGVQICGNIPRVMTQTAQLLEEQVSLDFVDLNLGCPIDALYQVGCGSGMMARKGVLSRTCHAMSNVLREIPLTVKLRTGITSTNPLAHNLMPLLRTSGVALATVHGRSREQRYTKNADWLYIESCAKAASPMPIFGNGDILSYQDYLKFLETAPSISGAMIGRGALIKPWIFTEIKERRHWDISSGERFDIVKKYVNYGLEHWGSDTRGVETTRRFLLEWLSFLYRYVPLGLLERPPQQINQRPPVYRGRDDLETMLSSPNCSHWIQISEMLLGKVPEGFVFLPKHKSNSWK